MGAVVNSGIPGVDEAAMPSAQDHPELKEEWNLHVLEQTFKMNDGSGYQHQGSPFSRLGSIGSDNPNAPAPIITKAQELWTYKDVMQRKKEGKPVIPIFSWEDELGHERHVLTDEDKQAQVMGYLCEVCLQWQDTPLSDGDRCMHDWCRAIRMPEPID